MKKTVALLVAFYLTFGMYAGEKEKFSHISLGFRGGISIIKTYGEYLQVEDRMNYLGGGNLEYSFNPRWGFGFDYVYMPYDMDYGISGKLTALAHEITAYTSFNISNIVAPYRSGNWQKLNFYGNLGGGISLFDYDNTMSKQKGNDKCLVIPMGFMIEYNLGGAFAINLGSEYRWHNYSDMKKEFIGDISGLNNGFFTGTLGVKFKFGGSKEHVRNISYPAFEKARMDDECTPRFREMQATLQKEAATLNSKINVQESIINNQTQEIENLNGSIKNLENKLNGFISNIASKEQRNAEEIARIKKAQETVVKDAFNTLEFETGSAVIKSSSNKSLDKLAEVLKLNSTWKLGLNGYTDNTGNAEANIRLSKERAGAVKNYLVERGISSGRITAEGHGAENPVASNATAEGRAKNRRVEIQID